MSDHLLNKKFTQGASGHAVHLLHGLCGSPLEMGAIPRGLENAGHSVCIPSIRGYAEQRLAGKWHEWIEAIEIEIEHLRKNHDSVSLCGLSMGATLALAVAARRSDIKSLVLLSSVLKYDGWSVPWYRAVLYLAYWLGIRNWSYRESDPYGICNVEMRQRVAKSLQTNGMAEVGAAQISAKHLCQANLLMSDTFRRLADVMTDTLLIHAIDDETASPHNAEKIFSRISSEVRKIIWLGDSYHIITVDNEREVVTNETVRFLSRGHNIISLDAGRRSTISPPMKDRRRYPEVVARNP
jgi:carboxylesterase